MQLGPDRLVASRDPRLRTADCRVQSSYREIVKLINWAPYCTCQHCVFIGTWRWCGSPQLTRFSNCAHFSPTCWPADGRKDGSGRSRIENFEYLWQQNGSLSLLQLVRSPTQILPLVQNAFSLKHNVGNCSWIFFTLIDFPLCIEWKDDRRK